MSEISPIFLMAMFTLSATACFAAFQVWSVQGEIRADARSRVAGHSRRR